MLLASPVIAIVTRPSGAPPVNAQARLLAAEVERVWHEATPQTAWRLSAATATFVLGVVAYAADKPRAMLPDLPAPGAEELKRRGMVLLCFTGDVQCLRAAALQAGSAPSRTTQTIDHPDRVGQGHAGAPLHDHCRAAAALIVCAFFRGEFGCDISFATRAHLQFRDRLARAGLGRRSVRALSVDRLGRLADFLRGVACCAPIRAGSARPSRLI